MLKFIAVIFVIGVAAGNPLPWDEASDECKLASEREQCFPIFIEANQPEFAGMKAFFQHYCRKIGDWETCLEESEADYEAMSRCPEDVLFFEDKMFMIAFVHLFDHLKTWQEMFNITLDFIHTVHDIVCTRTDETINLVNCITMNYEKEFKPLTIGCWEEHMVELGNKLGHKPDEIDATEICSYMDSTIPLLPDYRKIKSKAIFIGRTPWFMSGIAGNPEERFSSDMDSTYGFTTCMKDGFTNMCGTQYSDLLDTAYYNVVEDVIGNGFGCSESTPSEPLLEFARSVRNLYRK